MRVVVDGSGHVLAESAEEARTMWSRFKGLMLRRGLPDGGGLVIAPCGSIHMFFMRFTIDAVFFNREGRVTKVARSVRPWIGLAFGGRGAHGVVELPRHAAEGVNPGDTLRFER